MRSPAATMHITKVLTLFRSKWITFRQRRHHLSILTVTSIPLTQTLWTRKALRQAFQATLRSGPRHSARSSDRLGTYHRLLVLRYSVIRTQTGLDGVVENSFTSALQSKVGTTLRLAAEAGIPLRSTCDFRPIENERDPKLGEHYEAARRAVEW